MRTPEAGSTIAGRFRVEGTLGEGAIGVVLAARHIQLDQRVAIKLLSPAALQNPETVSRFSREARAAAKIRGEHVARIFDVAELPNGVPFMVMEYLKGEDLSRVIATRGPVPIQEAVRYVLQACKAIAEAHAMRIVHRDLKPSNLFLAKQPDQGVIVKVLDFGISKFLDASGNFTTKNTALGTPCYMSPEQIRAPAEVDHRTDIWSLGVILYELLTGEPPFYGESVPIVLTRVLENQPVPVSAMRQELPSAIDDVIGRCLETDPLRRYDSVADLARGLAPFAAPSDVMEVSSIGRVLVTGGSDAPPPRERQSAPAIEDTLPTAADRPVDTGRVDTAPMKDVPAIAPPGDDTLPGGPRLTLPQDAAADADEITKRLPSVPDAADEITKRLPSVPDAAEGSNPVIDRESMKALPWLGSSADHSEAASPRGTVAAAERAEANRPSDPGAPGRVPPRPSSSRARVSRAEGSARVPTKKIRRRESSKIALAVIVPFAIVVLGALFAMQLLSR